MIRDLKFNNSLFDILNDPKVSSILAGLLFTISFAKETILCAGKVNTPSFFTNEVHSVDSGCLQKKKNTKILISNQDFSAFFQQNNKKLTLTKDVIVTTTTMQNSVLLFVDDIILHKIRLAIGFLFRNGDFTPEGECAEINSISPQLKNQIMQEYCDADVVIFKNCIKYTRKLGLIPIYEQLTLTGSAYQHLDN